MTDRRAERVKIPVAANLDGFCPRRPLSKGKVGDGRWRRAQIVDARIRDFSDDHVFRVAGRRLIADAVSQGTLIPKKLPGESMVDDGDGLRGWQVPFIEVPTLQNRNP